MSDELKNYLGNINYEIETSDIELEKLDLGLNAKSWKELLGYINRLNMLLNQADNKNLELIELINKIYDVIENRNITGIEARLEIQNILENKGDE